MSKQIIGALIGAVIGAGAMIGLEAVQQQEAAWTVLVIAVLAGLGARMMGTGRSFVAGAAAALLTIVCFMGGKFAGSYITRKSAEKPQLTQSSGGGEVNGEDTGESSGASSAAETAAFEEGITAATKAPSQSLDYSSKQSPMDTIWLVVGVGLAYFIGRGSGPLATATPQSEPPDAASADDRPAEPTGDDQQSN